MDLKKLYQEQLVEHYNHPRCTAPLARVDRSSGICNPSCGDMVTIEVMLEGSVITQARFAAQGCVISCATASLLLHTVTGNTVEEIQKLDTEFMKNLVGIPLGPTRLRCALLALEALQTCLQKESNA